MFDTITDYETPPFLSPQKHGWVALALGRGGQGVYPTGIPRMQAFFRTLMADLNEDRGGHTRLDPCSTSFFDLAASFLFTLPVYVSRTDAVPNKTIDPQIEPDYIIGLLRFLRQPRADRSDRELLETFFGCNMALPDEGNDLRGGTRGLVTFSMAEPSATRHRGLFLTQNGYMGLATSRIAAGDRVCVLPSCPLPLILREEGSECVLVSECFVLGLMDGEVLKDVEQGRGAMQELCIC